MMIDYVGTLWPFGLQAEVEPIYFNSVMVKRVISEGLLMHMRKSLLLKF